jgi:hypothetical protein
MNGNRLRSLVLPENKNPAPHAPGPIKTCLRLYLCGFDVPDCGCLVMGVS